MVTHSRWEERDFIFLTKITILTKLQIHKESFEEKRKFAVLNLEKIGKKRKNGVWIDANFRKIK